MTASRGSAPDAIPFVPAESGTPQAATVFRCPLCGGSFTHGALACGGCPLHAGCDILQCPSCGYQFPRSSRIVDGIMRLARRLGVGR